MQILKYTDSIQKQLGSKTKSEHWLHIIQLKSGDFAIYVWDTRKVIEQGKSAKQIYGTAAIDSHAKLVGADKVFDVITVDISKAAKQLGTYDGSSTWTSNKTDIGQFTITVRTVFGKNEYSVRKAVDGAGNDITNNVRENDLGNSATSCKKAFIKTVLENI